jgi:complex III assembly factor LYRM7
MSSNLYKTGYRRLLRSARFAFAGDANAVSKAKVELRTHFYQNKNIKDKEHLAMLAKDIAEVEEMLRFRIVQGKRNDAGNFGNL